MAFVQPITIKEAIDSINKKEFLIPANALTNHEKEKSKFASRTLFKLYEVIHKNKPINFFLEKNSMSGYVKHIQIRLSESHI